MFNFDEILNINNSNDFDLFALELFDFQYKNNLVYKQFVDYLKVDTNKVNSIEKIPFLPIEFFKNKKIITEHYNLSDDNFKLFKSSGTTSEKRSTHYIYNTQIYEKSFISGFQNYFGNISDYVILALLPSYLEAGDSSLVFMVNKLIELTQNNLSGFYLNNQNDLVQKLEDLNGNKKVILFGVTYALLDLVEKIKNPLEEIIIIETGGMKGRRKEITREELHIILKSKFLEKNIYSEYGMTELLSQAYSNYTQKFTPSKTLKVLIRDINDPFTYLPDNNVGAINIIDLANIYSCCFIETKDLGRKYDESSFSVEGRLDNTDIRGCNLLIL